MRPVLHVRMLRNPHDPASARPPDDHQKAGSGPLRKDQGRCRVPCSSVGDRYAHHEVRKNVTWTAYVTQSRTQRLTADKGVWLMTQEQSQLHGTHLGQFEPAHLRSS